MSNRISFDPKIFPIILENWPPMVTALLCRRSVALSIEMDWRIGGLQDWMDVDGRWFCSERMRQIRQAERFGIDCAIPWM